MRKYLKLMGLLALSITAAVLKSYNILGLSSLSWWWVNMPLWVLPALVLLSIIGMLILRLFGKEVRNVRK
jgi:hypothetical protein